jgi:signal peptidase I
MRRFVSITITVLPILIRLYRLGLIRRYVVDGRSMLGAFAPGERLVVEGATYRLLPPRLGDAVVVRQPGGGKRLVLKRVGALPGMTVTVAGEPYVLDEDEWYIVGDNAEESTDSRQLGPVRRQDIVGRVWFRY